MMVRYLWAIRVFLLLLISVTSRNCFAQVFTGRVIDSQKSVGLPYANVSIRGKSVGGIADIRGHFAVDIRKSSLDDSILISSLGYESVTLARRDLTSKFYEIKLSPVSYPLNEVVAYAKRAVIIIGNKAHGRQYTGWGDHQRLQGRVRGAAIQPEIVPLKLARFVMRLHENTFDSVLFRIHIIPVGPSYQAGEENELLNENIFVTCKKNQNWVYVDLTPYHIIINGPVVVAAEWVDSWAKRGSASDGSKLLTISVSKKDGYFYQRKMPGEPFAVTKESFTPTMYFETYKVTAQD
jgi:hypothetical protein